MHRMHAEKIVRKAAKTTGMKRAKFVNTMYLAMTNEGVTKDDIGRIFDEEKKKLDTSIDIRP